MDTADVILFMVDGKDGLTTADHEVANMLMRTGKKVVLIVNKIDSPKSKNDIYDFYELGLGEPIPISAVNMLNLEMFSMKLWKHFRIMKVMTMMILRRLP